MKQTHGLEDVPLAIKTKGSTQQVLVSDGSGAVVLSLSSCYPAALRPGEARYIASAERVESAPADPK